MESCIKQYFINPQIFVETILGPGEDPCSWATSDI